MSILKTLHDSEINASIATFWDGCFIAKLGDEMNGFIAEKVCGSYEEAEAFLDGEARRQFPSSAYATGAHPLGYNPALVGVGLGSVSANGESYSA